MSEKFENCTQVGWTHTQDLQQFAKITRFKIRNSSFRIHHFEFFRNRQFDLEKYFLRGGVRSKNTWIVECCL